MSISVRCPVCKSSFKLTTPTCTKCGNNLRTNRSYKVRIKLSSGQWVTQQVDSLDMAQKVEAKFRVQVVEEKVFDIIHSPYVHVAWSKYLRWAKHNIKSWANDELRWEKHIAPSINSLRMDKVTPQIVQGIMDTMWKGKTPQGRPYKPKTVKEVLVLIKRLYNWSIRQELYRGDNPCTRVDVPKFDNRVTNPLDKEGVGKLLETLNVWGNERASLIVQFALYSGRRRGEILKLRWNDINVEQGFVTFRGENAKNGSTQILPLNENCLRILNRSKELKIFEYVFPANTGKYYSGFAKVWGRIKKEAGVSVRFHDLRHTFASHLASSGQVDILVLKELLGHKSLTMTQRYAHLINGALRRGVDVADKVYG